MDLHTPVHTLIITIKEHVISPNVTALLGLDELDRKQVIAEKVHNVL